MSCNSSTSNSQKNIHVQTRINYRKKITVSRYIMSYADQQGIGGQPEEYYILFVLTERLYASHRAQEPKKLS